MQKIPSKKMSMRDRVAAVLKGDIPDRLPFVDRIELWYQHHRNSPTMPKPYRGMTLNAIHQDLGMGRQKFVMPQGLELKGVELKAYHNGEMLLQETDPIYQEFPALNAPAFVPREKVGDTEIQFFTPRGSLRIKKCVVMWMGTLIRF
jgi:hypothetical protein